MVNSFYDAKVLKLAKERLKEKGIMQLRDFLSREEVEKFQRLKWGVQYEPKTCSYRRAVPPLCTRSKSFLAVVRQVVGKRNVKVWECRAFEHGDYTVLYDALKPGKGVALFLDMNACQEEWGGYSVFLRNGKEVVRLVPRANTLTLVSQSGLKSFVKYVNYKARHPRVFLYGVLQ